MLDTSCEHPLQTSCELGKIQRAECSHTSTRPARISLCSPLDSTDTDSYELRHLFKLSLANATRDQRRGGVLLRLSRFAETCEPAISIQQRSKLPSPRRGLHICASHRSPPSGFSPIICDGSVSVKSTFVMSS